MKSLRFILSSLLAVATATALAQTPCFNAQSLPPTSLTLAGLPANGPVFVSAGDINGDGNADLVTSNLSQSLSWLLGNGAGGFAAPISLALTHNSSANALADLNGDGRLDIVSFDGSNTQTFNILLRNGLGGFNGAMSMTAAPGYSHNSMALGDVTGDGRVDIVTANNDAGGITVWAGTGTGGFGTPTTTTFNVPAPVISLGLIDNNTSLDVLIASKTGNYVLRGLNNGSGTFNFTGGSYAVDTGPTNAVLTDVNADGRNDLLTANATAATMTVRLNNGSGGFGTRTEYEVNNIPAWLTMADVDGNGKPDAVLAMTDAGNVTIKPGNGTGGFGESIIYSTVQGSLPTVVVTPDLTGDARPDLVTPDANGVGLSVLLNNGYGGFLTYNTGAAPTAIAIGDLNGDARLDIATITQSLGNNILLHIAQPGGVYALPVTLSVSANLTDIGIMDVNGDGNNDLLLTKTNGTSTNGELLTMLGAGNGTFGTPTSQTVGLRPAQLFIADVNRDSRPDVLVLNIGSSTTSLFLGTGSGLSAPTNQASGGGDADLVATDINGNGAVDLITVNSGSGVLYELYGNGDGTFSGSVMRTVGTAPKEVAAGDLNNDGRIDLVVTLPNSNEIRILQNTGNAGNLPNGAASLIGTNLTVGGTPDAVELADLNGDGRLDIAVTQRTNNAVRILYNTGAMSFTTSTTIATGQSPLVMTAGRIGGDNRPGLVVGNYNDRTLTIINNCTPFPSVSIKPYTSLTVAAGQPLSLTAVPSLFTPTSYTWTSRPDWPYGFGGYYTDPTITETAPGVEAPMNYTITVFASSSLLTVSGTKVITVVPTFLQTVKDGTWTDPTVWSGGYVPLGYEVVRIGHDVLVPAKPGNAANYTLKVIYTAGGKLRFASGARLYFGPD